MPLYLVATLARGDPPAVDALRRGVQRGVRGENRDTLGTELQKGGLQGVIHRHALQAAEDLASASIGPIELTGGW